MIVVSRPVASDEYHARTLLSGHSQ